ncbi:MAG: helix-turn-helix transcriptional regulator [Phycisphaerales bacterium]|nr:helix-turn-helix transcriptional regulator [Phycisphaerales bacterium]
MEPEAMDNLFDALSSPVRRRVLDLLLEKPGQTVAGLSASFTMSGVGLLKHVRVLERAGLVIAEKRGRERWLYVNIVPIQQIYDRWTTDYAKFWAGRVVDLKERLESGAASGSTSTKAPASGVKRA